MFKKDTNTGKDNSGYYNSGDYNSGYYNSGDYNSGNRNGGHRNSGNYNSGDYNSGNRNGGYYNSGNHNSGHCNSGDYNSGYSNSGYYNSGNHNSGHCNSGEYNSGNYNSGFFNTDEPTVRLFNKDTGKLRSEITIPYFHLKITEWIPEEKMTDQQKKDDVDFFVKKGTLITRSYKEAWSLAWKEMTPETRKQFTDLPNFDAIIFKEITGIDLTEKEKPTCSGKIVEIDGKKYKLTEV